MHERINLLTVMNSFSHPPVVIVQAEHPAARTLIGTGMFLTMTHHGERVKRERAMCPESVVLQKHKRALLAL